MPPAAPVPSGGPEGEVLQAKGWIRPKGNLGPRALWIVAILMTLPLISVLIRSLAAPVVSIPGLEGLQHLGRALDKMLSLNDVPPQQQGTALRLLLLPLSALLVSMARLTLGIRLLGFRSILIAVGFNQSGVVGSLILIAIAVTTIVLVRPVLKSIHLPYFGRVPVIICIVACTMVSAMLLSPWVNSKEVAGVAYFPVIVLAMLAEGFANTLDRDNAIAAGWRVLTTVTLAFLIAMLSWIPELQEVMLQYPELVIPQVVAIVLVSEYFDLKLLSSWDARLGRMFAREQSARAARFRVVVVREAALSPAEAAAGEHPAHKPRSVTKVVHALRRAGFSSLALEAGSKLTRQLKAALAPTKPGGRPRGIVLYAPLAGPAESGAVVTSAMIERAGIGSAGPGPSGHALATDLLAVRTVLRQSGVHIPNFVCVSDHRDRAVEELRFPVSVRPRMNPNIRPKMVSDPAELRSAVRHIVRRSDQDALVEEHVKGRRMSACLIGNDSVTCLPLVATNPRDRTKVSPTLVDEEAAERVREHALLAFHALGCKDYARVDVSVSGSGRVWVLEVRSQGLLASRGAFAVAAAADGREYHQLLRDIIDVARARLAPVEEPRRKQARTGSDTQQATPAGA